MGKLAMPYAAAINWILANDDIDWVKENGIPSVTACLVADIYNKSLDTVTKHLKRGIQERGYGEGNG